MTFSYWQKDELGPDVHCDVAVVGGGIVGCSTAYWLKKLRPRMSVALIESRTLGHGASGRNAGFLLQGAAVDYTTDVERYGEEKAVALWDFTMENRDLIAVELNPHRIYIEPTGSLLLAGSPEEDDRLKHSAELLNDRGISVSHLTTGEVHDCTGGIGFSGGLKIASGAALHSLRLLREIAGNSGARILEHHPVVSVDETSFGVSLQTTRRFVRADRTILALNAYLPLLLPETSRYIRPVRAQMLSTRPLAPWLRYPIYSHEGYYYLRQTRDGSLLLGGARHLFVDEEIGYADRITPDLQQALIDYLQTHFPSAGTIEVDRRWSGVMAFTGDGLPIVSSESEHCWWAAGFNGHGMGYGFRFGRLLAEMHLGLDTGGIGGLFDKKRFEKG